jgi:hypothetical protein
MPRVGFEPTTPVFERTKTVHAADRTATVIGLEIFRLLKILITLPVTTAELERCFSTLNRIKSFLENTMGERRLKSLVMSRSDQTNKLPLALTRTVVLGFGPHRNP